MELRQAKAALRVARAAAAEEKSGRETLESKFDSAIADAVARALAVHENKQHQVNHVAPAATTTEKERNKNALGFELQQMNAADGGAGGDLGTSRGLNQQQQSVVDDGDSSGGGGGRASGTQVPETSPMSVATAVSSARILTNRHRDKHLMNEGGRSGCDIEGGGRGEGRLGVLDFFCLSSNRGEIFCLPGKRKEQAQSVSS